MKIVKTIVIMGLAVAVLTGCGPNASTSNAQTNMTTSNKSTDTNTVGSETGASSGIQQGVTSMLSVVEELGKQITSGDASKAAASGEQLEATWHSFEDSVHTQYASSYKDVETYLDPLVAGTKISPLDKKTLGNLNQQLQTALQSLQKSLK